MSSDAVIIAVLLLQLLQTIECTFPPVSNPPPIPNQGVRIVDTSGSTFFIQDDLPSEQSTAKTDSSPDPKVDDQRLFVPENQSDGELGYYPSSTEAFDRYFADGGPAIGPVATPLPDDTYQAQPSGSLKVIPSGSSLGQTDILVLAKGDNDQYVPERWIQVQMPQERIAEGDIQDTSPKILFDNINTFPPLQQTKNQGLPLPSNVIRQIWIRSPSPVQTQKAIQSGSNFAGDLPSMKQYVDSTPTIKQYVDGPPIKQYADGPPPVKQYVEGPPPKQYVEDNRSIKQYVEDTSSIKQYVQTQNIPPSTAPIVPKSGFSLPPPLPYKGGDIVSSKQTVIRQPDYYKASDISPPKQGLVVDSPQYYKGIDNSPQTILVDADNYKGSDVISPKQAVEVVQPQYYTNDGVVPPLPTVLVDRPDYKGGDVSLPKQTVVINPSQVGSVVGKSGVLMRVKHIWVPTSQQTGKFITVPFQSGKSIPPQGMSISGVPPIAVSDTWVLKQDGPLPRFVQQKSSFVDPSIQKGQVLGNDKPVFQFDSPKNPSLSGIAIDTTVPVNNFPNPNFVSKTGPATFPNNVKYKSIGVNSGAGLLQTFAPPKSYIQTNKGYPPSPPPIASPPLQTIKNKPCPLPLQKGGPALKSLPPYRTIATFNRQPLPRIIRLKRYPYGSYYVLNPRMGPSLYSYPKPQVLAVQPLRNGLRIVPAKQTRLPVQGKQFGISVPSSQFGFSSPPKQIAISVPRRQVILPQTKGKVQPFVPQFTYSPVRGVVNPVRYAYPWGNYLRSLPTASKSIFLLPPPKPKTKATKTKKPATLKKTSPESSSSESSSSESKSADSKESSPEKITLESGSKSKEEVKSEESASERESEDVDSAASEVESESAESKSESETETSTEESETSNESIQAAETQLKPRLVSDPRINARKLSLNASEKPFSFSFTRRNTAGTGRYDNEMYDLNGRVIGSYGSVQGLNGLNKNIAFYTSAPFDKLKNGPTSVNNDARANINYIFNTPSERDNFKTSKKPESGKFK